MQSDNQIPDPQKIIFVIDSLHNKPDNNIREQLIFLVNELINKDFDSLLQLLYRIDVNENKIRVFLKENIDQNSASIIADLIIDRQLQKIETRKRFAGNKTHESDEEKW
ncbi:MAG: hypothetical protein M3Z26_16125 [Bacteroidota bacterium]|nr:hypothetical protein [Bacteroidota bacterium]